MDLVIFIHGALSSPSSWAFHRRVLKPLLKTKTVVSAQYDVERSTSEDISKDLVKAILKLMQATKFDRVMLLGHSFGGVLAIDAVRILLKDHADDCIGSKFRVFALSSPLGGSGAASLFRVFKPFSQFLKNVGSFDSYMTKFKSRQLPCPVYSVVSTAPLSPDYPIQKSDGVVTLESQTHYQRDPQCYTTHVTSNHFEVLLSEKVTEEIKKFMT